ncbi:hypothetical protein LIER_34953 [Lithospermum erythrorhizon]|uniref:PLAC8 motif-containing protein n=1 Tax=Lithospermum erythrorhizon TaxID=34254 RepID=A0AAV3NHZ4_LITER
MVSGDNCEQNGGDEESSGCKVKGVTPLDVSTSQRGLISENQTSEKLGVNKFRFLGFGSLESPSTKFQRIALERDEVSRGVPSSSSLREQFGKLFKGKIDWNSLQKMCREWIRNPLNMALCIWILCVAVSGAILFLVMTGMLDRAIPKKSQRDVWFEVNNQILNALFTLMCLYMHPMRFYHLILLLRWNQDDITKLRKTYCKNGTYKPHEWMHMMVVVILLHINCFAQYALCALNVGYRRSERPAIGVGICISFAIAAPAFAGLYSSLSPLGKDYNSDFDEEAQIPIASSQPETSKKSEFRRKSLERRFSFASQDEGKAVVTSPTWRGGIMDLWDDISVAYLSLFCTVCVFGWNMGRLGFGNMYVHIATFLLFCLAPFFIFNLAAVNIDNESVREALGIIGLFLCVFGLLYGGFWRIQMRKRFNLPSYTFCFNRPAVSDCVLWLCCCWCSLAQEVRTGNTYDVIDQKFCEKDVKETNNLPISALPREGGEFQFVSSTKSPFKNSSSQSEIMNARSPSPSRFLKEYTSPAREFPCVDEESHTRNTDEAMRPPAHSVINRECN